MFLGYVVNKCPGGTETELSKLCMEQDTKSNSGELKICLHFTWRNAPNM